MSGVLNLAIDSDGDGIFELSGEVGEKFHARYATTGTFIAEAIIDQISVGTFLVFVMDVDLEKPIACEVGYMREKNIVIAPASKESAIVFSSPDLTLLEISRKDSFSNVDGEGQTISLKTLRRGKPLVTARIGNNFGPLIAIKEVDEFTRDIPSLFEIVVNENTNAGVTILIQRPYIPDIRYQFTMFASTSTFEGGVTSFSVNTSDLDPLTQKTLFNQVYDSESGETVGEFTYGIDVPAGEDKYCYTVQVFQASSEEKIISGKDRVNGGVCKGKVKDLLLCVGKTGDLIVEITQKAKHDLHEIKIVRNNINLVGATFTKDGYTSETAKVSCVDGKTVPNPLQVLGKSIGEYDITIAGTPFEKAIKIIDPSKLTILPVSAEFCVGDTQTFKAYKCVNDKPKEVFVDWSVKPENFAKIKGEAFGISVEVQGIASGKPTTLTATRDTPAESAKASITVLPGCEFDISATTSPSPLYFRIPASKATALLKLTKKAPKCSKSHTLTLTGGSTTKTYQIACPSKAGETVKQDIDAFPLEATKYKLAIVSSFKDNAFEILPRVTINQAIKSIPDKVDLGFVKCSRSVDPAAAATVKTTPITTTDNGTNETWQVTISEEYKAVFTHGEKQNLADKYWSGAEQNKAPEDEIANWNKFKAEIDVHKNGHITVQEGKGVGAERLHLDNRTLTATKQNGNPLDRQAAQNEANRLATEAIRTQADTFYNDAKTAEDNAHNAYHARVGESIDPTPYLINGRE